MCSDLRLEVADLPGVFNADSGQRIDLEDIEMCLVRVNATKGCSDPMQDVSFFRDVDVTTKLSIWRHDVSHMISSNFEVGRASAILNPCWCLLSTISSDCSSPQHKNISATQMHKASSCKTSGIYRRTARFGSTARSRARHPVKR